MIDCDYDESEDLENEMESQRDEALMLAKSAKECLAEELERLEKLTEAEVVEKMKTEVAIKKLLESQNKILMQCSQINRRISKCWIVGAFFGYVASCFVSSIGSPFVGCFITLLITFMCVTIGMLVLRLEGKLSMSKSEDTYERAYLDDDNTKEFLLQLGAFCEVDEDKPHSQIDETSEEQFLSISLPIKVAWITANLTWKIGKFALQKAFKSSNKKQ
mmetsp:Transcript_20884/g.30982  ORF Transcript_20884/g.30982 Transcript_20884/m.30982 type:complete len:218 (+) Transcript_20884:233-886(+)